MTYPELTTVEALYPPIRIKAYDQLWIEGDEYIAQKKQGDKWVLVAIDTQEIRIESDGDLVQLQGYGKLQVRSRPVARPPLSPLATASLDSKPGADLVRKHDYVEHVLHHPDGFRTSKNWVEKCIAERATARDDPNPPSPGSVLNWKKLHDAHYAEIGLAAYAPRHDLKGKRGSNLPKPKTDAIEAGLDRYLQGGSVEDAYVEILKKVDDFNRSPAGKRFCREASPKHLDDKGQLPPPSRSTFRREVARLSPFTKNYGRKGQYYARKHGRTYQTRALPKRPYEEVEVDFTPVDLILVAENGAYLGRPHLIAFLDRATRMVLGISVSFDVPGYAAVIEGLRHATYLKDIEHIDGLNNADWPCMGRIERLYIDNGKEFANGHLASAAQHLGFEIHRLPPREPWHKGLVERFMGEVARFSHRFPGTTHSNSVVHRDFENPEAPVLTLSEFRDFIIKWVVTDYNRKRNRMLGDVPGVARAPIDAWRDKLSKMDIPGLPSEELFIALAGEREERTVQKYGVEWDHIRYWSPELDRILAHPDHKFKSSAATDARYQVNRDPYDLSKIYLHNHHSNEVMILPVVDKWRTYTDGLTLHQHKMCREHELIREEQRGDPEALWKARANLIETGMGALQSGRRKNLERKLTRFLYGKGALPFASKIQDQNAVAKSPGPIRLSASVEPPAIISSLAEADGSTASLIPDMNSTLSHKHEPDDLAKIMHLAAKVSSGVRHNG